MHFLLATLLVLSASAFQPAQPATPTVVFDECGTLIQGIECILFETETDTYQLSTLDGHEIGENIRVVGDLFLCELTFCSTMNCVEVSEITLCSVSSGSESWGTLKARYDED